jgi:GNAT superfamily N-acetyltransferase
LAVNQEYSHKGIGSEALLFIKQWFLSPDNKTGCRFVVIDAVNGPNVLQFNQKNGFVFLFTSKEQEFIYTGGKAHCSQHRKLGIVIVLMIHTYVLILGL